jgi:beta-N-acetylhexosaminidase
MALGAADSPELAEQVSNMLATEMRALGINWVFAPMVDITHDINNPSVGTRSLGSDKQRVSRLAAAEVRGFQGGGVAACAKHFPGLGNTLVDTHEALAVISCSVDYLWDHDLVPFKAAIDAGTATVMTTHVKFQALDKVHPATLSPVIIRKLLREVLGYDGVVCTDCMEMKAIADHYGAGESAVLAALAGVDLILFSHTQSAQEAAYEALLDAARSGRLPETDLDQAVARIRVVKQRFAITEPSSTTVIGHKDHLALAERAARAGTVMLKVDHNVFPLKPGERRIAVVEFASYLDSAVMDRGGLTGLITELRRRAPGIESISLPSTKLADALTDRDRQMIAETEVLVVATRSAHLRPEQLQLARELIGQAAKVVLLCLRNPYDVNVLPEVETILCTCGDSRPSLRAAVDALMGDFTPSGRLPVDVSPGMTM